MKTFFRDHYVFGTKKEIFMLAIKPVKKIRSPKLNCCLFLLKIWLATKVKASIKLKFFTTKVF